MVERDEDYQYRLELFMVTGELPLSQYIDEKILLDVASYPENEKESRAKEILELIKDCKTEAEVKKALKY